MMPKHSMRDAIDDCVDGYRWLLDRGYSGRQIVLAGDSAGGYLVFAVASRLPSWGGRDRREPTPILPASRVT